MDEPTEKTQNPREADATMIARDFSAPQETAASRASLIVIDGWEIGREFEVRGGGQIVGRADDAATVVSSPSVSRQHARIDMQREGEKCSFVITDLNSSNGTRVNNQPVTTAHLRNGDKIRMGDVLFKFVIQDEHDARFHQEVHRLIHYDQLTGLMTMDAFRRQLEYTISRGSPDQPFTLAMTDLDGLKRVNDTYGHLAGRMVVREMGAMMRGCLRADDIAGLYGGDEAIVLYPGTPIAEARLVAEKLRSQIEDRVFTHKGHTFGVTISQGLAEWPRHGEEAEALITVADSALYAAKATGRNRVHCAGGTPDG